MLQCLNKIAVTNTHEKLFIIDGNTSVEDFSKIPQSAIFSFRVSVSLLNTD